jgi:tetratricopeptide (TPR) repeat protein
MRFTGILILFSLLAISAMVFGQNKPKKNQLLYEEAENAFRDNKAREALDLLNECLKADPGFLEAYSLRGSVKEMLNDNDGALTDYSIFLEQFPDHPEVLFSRATLRYQIGFYDQAKDDFLRLLTVPTTGETNSILYKRGMSVDDKNPMMTISSQGTHTSYIYNYLGLAESKLKNYQQAKIYFDSAIRQNPKEPDYFVNRGLAREAMTDSTAFKDYEQAITLNPNHVLAKHNLKAWKAKKAHTESLEDRLTQTIEADSTMLYPYLERAQQRYEAKYYQGAYEDYSMALEIDSMNVEIWLGRGLALEKMKDFKGAFSDYTKAIDLKENYAKAWMNRGNVLLKMERYADAIDDYNVALIYWPEYSLAFYNRAMAKSKLKKHDEACIDIKRAEELGMKVEGKVKDKICSK